MFKFSLVLLSLISVSCSEQNKPSIDLDKIEVLDTIESIESSEIEFIEVDDSLCDTDLDCVEKFGCVGLYEGSHRVDYACSQWDEN